MNSGYWPLQGTQSGGRGRFKRGTQGQLTQSPRRALSVRGTRYFENEKIDGTKNRGLVRQGISLPHPRERRGIYFLGKLSQKGSELTCLEQGAQVWTAGGLGQVCTLTVNPLCPFPIWLPGLQQSDFIQPKLESGSVPSEGTHETKRKDPHELDGSFIARCPLDGPQEKFLSNLCCASIEQLRNTILGALWIL